MMFKLKWLAAILRLRYGKPHMMQYKTQLRAVKKGWFSMAEYLLKIKSIVDALASAGHPIFEEEQTNTSHTCWSWNII